MHQPVIEMCTAFRQHRQDVQWTVKQWQAIHVTNEAVCSERFDLSDPGCYLEFHTDESHQDNQLNVYLSYSYGSYKKASAKAFIIDINGERHKLKGREIQITASRYTFYKHVFVVDKILVDNSNDILFYVELIYFKESKNANVNFNFYNGAEKLQKAILDDYVTMNTNQESLQQDDNITFIIGDVKIQAHSLILATASSYFSAMLRHDDFKESKERTVNLTNDNDVTAENFKIFLDILYGRTNIQNIDIQLVVQICILAHKYDLKQLLQSCDLILSRTVTNDNVVERLLFAEKYNCEYLKNKALQHAKANINVVKQLPHFDDLYENKDLLLQIL